MFDHHVTMAAVATRVQLGRLGISATREEAAKIFRDAAATWAKGREDWEGYEEWLDEQADRAEYERMVEM